MINGTIVLKLTVCDRALLLLFSATYYKRKMGANGWIISVNKFITERCRRFNGLTVPVT